MMDYFYKLVLKTLLLIGGIERNPGPKQGPPPLVAQYRGYEIDIWRKIVGLLERSLDPSCVVYQQLDDIKNCYPLPNVSGRGHLELLELLLDHGLDVNKVVDSVNHTLLHLAVFRGHVPVVRLLLQRGANINKTDSWGDTPLHDSSSNGHLTVCQLLVEAGCDLGVKDELGKTALERARDSGNTGVVKYLSSLK
uniref:Uncharacterized protein n=1 Tax=Timema shepardi TaxID=629360 RepID=A0A7R9G1K8_TIMSH|nr:unnamed protein product [Timema shepardi]